MMRTFVPTAIAALAIALAGCGKGHDAGHEQGASAGGAEIQVAGTLGCGHCNFHATNECAATVRTAAGVVYVLDGVDEKSDLWQKRLEPGHKLTVVGKVVGDDAVKHVAMTSFEFD